MGLGERSKDLGLLVLRVGIGIMFVAHGVIILLAGPGSMEGPKGPHGWVAVGSAMSYLGINFGHVAWGFAAGAFQAVGGLFLALGVFVRFFALLLLLIMLIAANMHLQAGQGFTVASHAIEDAIVFLALLFIGSGRYVLKLPKKHSTSTPS